MSCLAVADSTGFDSKRSETKPAHVSCDPRLELAVRPLERRKLRTALFLGRTFAPMNDGRRRSHGLRSSLGEQRHDDEERVSVKLHLVALSRDLTL